MVTTNMQSLRLINIRIYSTILEEELHLLELLLPIHLAIVWGAWLLEHISTRALASYVAPILIEEGYAMLNGDSKTEIIFK
ncbi:hypothetical protein V7087_28030 [Neobacillus niacini]